MRAPLKKRGVEVAAFITALGDLARAQKTRRGVSLYSRWINRPLGRLLAAGAYAGGLTPNMVTALSAVVTASGLVILVAMPPSLMVGVGVALLLILGFALDSADGQVARLLRRSSPAGEWLDHVVDAGKMVLVHTAVLLAGWRFWDGDIRWLLLPLAYQAISVVMFAGLTLVDLLERGSDRGPAAARSPSTLRAVALLPADYGVLAMSFLLWGMVEVFRIWYAALVVLNLIICIGMLIRWFRKLDRLTS